MFEKVDGRTAFGKYKPEGTVFVISIDKDSKPNGMVARWIMQCSCSPAMFAVALSKRGNTHKLIRESKEFVIAVPNKEMEKDLLYFGTTAGNEVNKFEETGICVVKADHLRVPLLADATVNLECKLVNEMDASDHIIFLGEVLECHVNKDKKVLLNMGTEDGKRFFEEF